MRALLIVMIVAACGPDRGPPPSPPHNRATEARAEDPTMGQTLTPEQRTRFDELARSKASPCGKAHSLLTSFERDPSCKRAPHALRYLARLVSDDTPDTELTELYDGRFADVPAQQFDVSRAPLVGSPSATCHLVVFADYECPHCAAFAPVLAELEARYGNRIAVHHKNFPITRHHPHSFGAAVAAVAAHRQGKFAPMHAAMFAHQGQLSASELEGYAQQVGLDLAAFRRDVASPDAAAQVEADLAEADRAGVSFVPAIYINGRLYRDRANDPAAIADWIDEQLDLAAY